MHTQGLYTDLLHAWYALETQNAQDKQHNRLRKREARCEAYERNDNRAGSLQSSKITELRLSGNAPLRGTTRRAAHRVAHQYHAYQK